jgi:hypothetical protein
MSKTIIYSPKKSPGGLSPVKRFASSRTHADSLKAKFEGDEREVKINRDLTAEKYWK